MQHPYLNTNHIRCADFIQHARSGEQDYFTGGECNVSGCGAFACINSSAVDLAFRAYPGEIND